MRLALPGFGRTCVGLSREDRSGFDRWPLLRPTRWELPSRTGSGPRPVRRRRVSVQPRPSGNYDPTVGGHALGRSTKFPLASHSTRLGMEGTAWSTNCQRLTASLLVPQTSSAPVTVLHARPEDRTRSDRSSLRHSLRFGTQVCNTQAALRLQQRCGRNRTERTRASSVRGSTTPSAFSARSKRQLSTFRSRPWAFCSLSGQALMRLSSGTARLALRRA